MVTCIVIDRLSAVNKLRYAFSMQLFDPTNQNFRSIPVTPPIVIRSWLLPASAGCPGDEC
jgi:hypothetical protein